MTPAEFTTFVRYKTRTNSTTLSDSDILALMKIRQDEIAREILKAREDILLIPQYADLVAGYREYPLPSDIIASYKRVEAKLDGTNWLKLTEIDLTQISFPISTEADIVARFANLEDECFYDQRRNAIYIYSGTITDVSDGLRVWCNTYPAPITDLTSTTDMSIDPSTTTHGIPRELHELWARGVIIDYKESREKPIPLNEREIKYVYDLHEAVATMKNANQDREVRGLLPPASTRGNDGSDY